MYVFARVGLTSRSRKLRVDSVTAPLVHLELAISSTAAVHAHAVYWHSLIG